MADAHSLAPTRPCPGTSTSVSRRIRKKFYLNGHLVLKTITIFFIIILGNLPPQEAKAQGDFLLVGLHTDEEVQERRGPHLPIMNCHERSLSVLACKYVDEVIIGAPSIISDDLIKTFNIRLVVRGTRNETKELHPLHEARWVVAEALAMPSWRAAGCWPQHSLRPLALLPACRAVSYDWELRVYVAYSSTMHAGSWWEH
jgi:hypothetical protein